MKTNTKNLIIKLCYPVESIFMDLITQINNITTDEIKYPNIIFYFNNDNCIAGYNSKNKYFWCNYNKFWSKFELNNSFNYMDVRYLLNPMVEEYFKLKGITTTDLLEAKKDRVEEYFKLKGITTTDLLEAKKDRVEEYFKLKGITTLIKMAGYLVRVEEHFKLK